MLEPSAARVARSVLRGPRCSNAPGLPGASASSGRPRGGRTSASSTPGRRKKALASIKAKAKAITRPGTNNSLSHLLRQLNGVLRGWTNYFRHGVSKATFAYVHQFSWLRVVGWLRRKHRRANWRFLRRRYLANGWWPEHDGMALFDCRAVPVTRYRYRGAAIPTPWSGMTTEEIA
ncbi:MAG: group II intron maturase-specific domain-containing protein [Acidimicrobiales bacterium]